MKNIVIKDAHDTDIEFGRIIFGGSNTTFLNGKLPSDFLSKCLNHDMFTIDTARVYGKGTSEEMIGEWMRRYHIPREKMTIITKCCHPSFAILPRLTRNQAFKDIEASLKALDVSYVDCLLLHRDNPMKSPEEIITFMNEIVSRGYTRSIGVSNWKAERIKKANDYARAHNMVPFTISECQFSLGNRVRDPWHNGTLSITGKENQKEREFYLQEHMPFLCFSALGDGFFAGKIKHDDVDIKKKLSHTSYTAYYSQENLEVLKRAEELAAKKNCSVSAIALSYCLHQEIDMGVIVSVSSEERILQNLAALDIELTKEERDYLTI
jgi:aryl-alcohol dehydrogenase-like predicted oxidoreductase